VHFIKRSRDERKTGGLNSDSDPKTPQPYSAVIITSGGGTWYKPQGRGLESR
jgi:hypothetical protein